MPTDATKKAFKAAILAGLLCTATPAFSDSPQSIAVPAGDLIVALQSIAQQSRVELLFDRNQLKGIRTNGVQGTLTVEQAIRKLLEGTNFQLSTDEATGAMMIGVRPAGGLGDAKAESSARPVQKGEHLASMQQVAQAEGSGSATAEETADVAKGVPEILVKGRRSLNTDIQRTEDDPQPYVVFDSREISRSQAVNLEDFLRTRLPMNTTVFSSGQTGGSSTVSSINLRGLGSNQTLILVDGRRLPGVTPTGIPTQPDLNGIPLSAIERVEVLPSTASGIYGGSATGGVINVILRRDFRGLEAKATYANTFDTDAANRRLDINAGFSLEGGRTRVMITAAHNEANTLAMGDRDFSARAIALQLANNPSAITGFPSPPIGATVNIRAVSGNLVLDQAYGGRALGFNTTHLPFGYAGPASDSGAALIANAGKYNLSLPAGMDGRDRAIMAAPSSDSVALNVRREFGQRFEAFVDLSRLGNEGRSIFSGVPNSALNLPASAPNNPFQQAISVRFPVPDLAFDNRTSSTTLRGTAGLIVRLPKNWMGELDYGWSRSRYRSVGTPTAVDAAVACILARGVGPGVDPDGAGPLIPCVSGDTRPALNALQEGNTFPLDFGPYLLPSPSEFTGPSDTGLRDATLRFSGPVLSLPAGALSLSVLLERRQEGIEGSIRQGTNTSTRATTYTFFPSRSQDADSYYMEARVPLLRSLELQASARRDEYLTHSLPTTAFTLTSRDGPFPALTYTDARLASTDYTVGLRYSLLQDVTLRASFGTGFVPPSVTQIAPTSAPFGATLGTDPKRGNSNTFVGALFTRVTGGNPGLRPESSESASAGLIFTPRFLPGLRLSLDYTRIDKIDEIQTPTNQFLLDNEDLFPGRIQRGTNLSTDLPGWAGPITYFDSTLLNVAESALEAYDVQIDYAWTAAQSGDFRGYVLMTWEPHYRNQILPITPMVDSVGFSGGPLEWRGNAGLEWERGPFALSWNMQYYDSYRVYGATTPAATVTSTVLSQGSTMIPRQVYHDVIASFRFDNAAGFMHGLLAGSQLSVGIQNLLDTSPPIVASGLTTQAGYSTYGDPRLRRYTVMFRKAFGSNQ